MKIIISHDVDHIGGWCHWWRDLYWEKFFAKSLIFLFARWVYRLSGGRICTERFGSGISFGLFLLRLKTMFARKMENTELLMDFDAKYGVPSTFFVGMDNVLGMSYSLANAESLIHKIMDRGFDVGVHGVAFDNQAGISAEHNRFEKICSNHQSPITNHQFGIRNHYLRGQENLETHKMQADAGYLFDSTDYGLNKPYRVGNMWEFPLSLMDAYLLADSENDLEDVKRKTLDALHAAEEKQLPYFMLLFHNPSRAFLDAWNWYQWVVRYLSANGYEFISFKDAVDELEGKA